jgi:serine protease Do
VEDATRGARSTEGADLHFAVPADWIGEMRTRSASSSDPVPAARPSASPHAQDDSPRRLIVGKWWCFGSISGRNGEYDYREDGTLTVASSDGMRASGRYSLSGRTVRYSVAGSGFSFAIETLTSEKMVLNIGSQGQRLVCDRR